MNIVVCIKQVPDTKGGVKFNPDGTLDRAAMLAIMNPDDKAGLEAALRIKDETGAKVTVLTMGLPKADAGFVKLFLHFQHFLYGIVCKIGVYILRIKEVVKNSFGDVGIFLLQFDQFPNLLFPLHAPAYLRDVLHLLGAQISIHRTAHGHIKNIIGTKVFRAVHRRNIRIHRQSEAAFQRIGGVTPNP